MDEREIIRLLRARDERGMEALLHRYTALMRYVIAPLLPDAQDREECLSEAAMRVWDGVGSYDPARGGFTAWLTAVTRNAALNRARARRDSAAPLRHDLPSDTPTPEERLLAQERREALRRALDTLTRQEAILFYRKYYYRQPTAQIAREMGLTERAVEGRLYRIRKALREKLGGETHDGSGI